MLIKVKVSDLKFTRYVHMDRVWELRKDIAKNGLLYLPTVFRDLYIISGNHRVAAHDPDSEIEVDMIDEDYTVESPRLETLTEPPTDPFHRVIERRPRIESFADKLRAGRVFFKTGKNQEFFRQLYSSTVGRRIYFLLVLDAKFPDLRIIEKQSIEKAKNKDLSALLEAKKTAVQKYFASL